MVKVYVQSIEDAYGLPVTIAQQAKHQVFGADKIVAEPQSFFLAVGDYIFYSW